MLQNLWCNCLQHRTTVVCHSEFGDYIVSLSSSCAYCALSISYRYRKIMPFVSLIPSPSFARVTARLCHLYTLTAYILVRCHFLNAVRSKQGWYNVHCTRPLSLNTTHSPVDSPVHGQVRSPESETPLVSPLPDRRRTRRDTVSVVTNAISVLCPLCTKRHRAHARTARSKVAMCICSHWYYWCNH